MAKFLVQWPDMAKLKGDMSEANIKRSISWVIIDDNGRHHLLEAIANHARKIHMADRGPAIEGQWHHKKKKKKNSILFNLEQESTKSSHSTVPTADHKADTSGRLVRAHQLPKTKSRNPYKSSSSGKETPVRAIRRLPGRWRDQRWRTLAGRRRPGGRAANGRRR